MKILHLLRSNRGQSLIDIILALIGIITFLLANGTDLSEFLSQIDTVPGGSQFVQMTPVVDKNVIEFGYATFLSAALATNEPGTVTLGAFLDENDGWRITKAQYHLGLTSNDIPQNKAGAPIPGHFAYKQQFTPGQLSFSNTVPLPDNRDNICMGNNGEIVVTMKLELEKEDDLGNVIEKAVWIQGTPFTKGWGQYTSNTVLCS
jgi:hypothetical protein